MMLRTESLDHVELVAGIWSGSNQTMETTHDVAGGRPTRSNPRTSTKVDRKD